MQSTYVNKRLNIKNNSLRNENRIINDAYQSGIFKMQHDKNNIFLEKKIKDIEFKYDTLKEHTMKIEKKKDEFESQILEFENLRMQTTCVDILNKVLILFLLISIFTTTAHSFDKIVSQGFSYFDWICFYIITMSFTTKFPNFVCWFDEKHKSYIKGKKKPY